MKEKLTSTVGLCILSLLGLILLLSTYLLIVTNIAPKTNKEQQMSTETTSLTKQQRKDRIVYTVHKEMDKDIVNDSDDVLAVVNKKRELPNDYFPNDLVIPKVPFPSAQFEEKKQMRKEAAGHLEKLFARAQKDGIHLVAISGYRSYNTQTQIFGYNARTRGFEKANQVSAVPGQSEHQTGLAMDVSSQSNGFDLTEHYFDLPEGQWLAKHAHEEGFIIRFPKGKEHITGYSYEPWHIRYVGKTVAEQIYKNNLTLEEYFGFVD